tara:strand:- start:348 stop:488 length:141 start_codon:yes stop_codon:yes gene_type:complete
MTESTKDNIKLQEWTVRFDGQISHSEKMINSDIYHKNVIKKNNEND